MQLRTIGTAAVFGILLAAAACGPSSSTSATSPSGTTITPSTTPASTTPAPTPTPLPAPTPTPAPAPTATTVTASIVLNASLMSNSAYSPNPISIHTGDSVMWVNNDTTTHTSTGANSAWDSGAIAPGRSFQTTFASAGTYNYHCSIHPNMTGTVVVQ